MEFIYNDGGRSKYFEVGNVGDCVTRAICNATGKDYKEVYDRLKYLERTMKVGKHERKGSVRNGTRKKVLKYYIEEELGWVKHSTVLPGQGVTMHLTEEEIPEGTLIVSLSKHLTCVKDKKIIDTYNCSEMDYYDRESGELVTNDTRAVYNYWTAPTKQQEDDKLIAKQLELKEKEAINQTKEKVQKVKDNYNEQIKLLKRKIRQLERKRDKEVDKIKRTDANKFISSILD